jgi:hypothetical protein
MIFWIQLHFQLYSHQVPGQCRLLLLQSREGDFGTRYWEELLGMAGDLAEWAHPSSAADRFKNRLRVGKPARLDLSLGSCLTLRVNGRTVRHLISTGHLALESSESVAYVACALEAWIYDNLPEPSWIVIAALARVLRWVNAAAAGSKGCQSSFRAARRSHLPQGGVASAPLTALYPLCGAYPRREVLVEAVGSVRKAGPKRRAHSFLLQSLPRAAWRESYLQCRRH